MCVIYSGWVNQTARSASRSDCTSSILPLLHGYVHSLQNPTCLSGFSGLPLGSRFYLGSARLKLNSPSYWLPLFHRVIPRPSVARFLVSGRCEAHLRRSRHALWLHLSPRRAGASCSLASLSQSEDETQQRRHLRGGRGVGGCPLLRKLKWSVL